MNRPYIICHMVTSIDGKMVGAVWVRDMNDYGHIAEGIPSFAISLYKGTAISE